MKPTVGRVVHYTSLGDRDGRYPSELHAAIITKVSQHTNFTIEGMAEENRYDVSLRIFYETGDFWMQRVSFTTERAGTEAARGKWSWPVRES
jgi:hypothetical protein